MIEITINETMNKLVVETSFQPESLRNSKIGEFVAELLSELESKFYDLQKLDASSEAFTKEEEAIDSPSVEPEPVLEKTQAVSIFQPEQAEGRLEDEKSVSVFQKKSVEQPKEEKVEESKPKKTRRKKLTLPQETVLEI